MAQDSAQAKYSEQNVLNNVYDQSLKTLAILNKGWNGQDGQTITPDAMAIKITTSGTDTYIGQAAPGTAQATAKWQAQKVDTNGNITWADSGGFTQAATDLTALTYA